MTAKQKSNLIKLAVIDLILLSLVAALLISCAPVENKTKADKNESTFSGDLPPATSAQIESSKISKEPRTTAYYSALDFSLPAGTVIAFSPSDDYLCSKTDEELSRIPEIFIHIQPEGDSPIKVQKITLSTWRILSVGSVLK